MNTMEEKLASVFPESFQVKRAKKEIEQIQESKEKLYYDARISFTRGQNLTFHILFQKGAFKKYKKLQNISNFEIKIILKREYPAQSPLIFCMSDVNYFSNQIMIDFGLEPFRDYSEFLAVQWSAKFTILDVIKIFPEFMENWSNDSLEGKKGKYCVNESFEVDKIFSWSFLQTFPVKFIDGEKGLHGGLFVISNQKELILLEEFQNRDSYCTKDLIQMEDVISIFKSRQGSREVLLEIKQRDTKEKKSLRFRSDDSENIVNYLVDYMKLAQTFQNNSEESLSEISEDEPEIIIESPKKTNIDAIKEEIVIYESQVENNMTSENVSNLVILLKKAIEYYSAVGEEDFGIYLQKLKTLMSNEMAQVLLDSASQSEKKINETEVKSPIYPSIVDIV